MLYVIVALLALVAVGWLIVKKINAAAAIFFVGVILLMISALLGTSDTTAQLEAEEFTGNAFYDQLLVIEALFKSKIAGTGMAIMVLFGFVAYMRNIGADAKTVVLLAKPLARLGGSYWLVPVGYIVGNLLSLVVPSASALSLLLIATLLPALVAAGLTPLTVGAIIATSSSIMPTPLEAGLIQGSDLTGIPLSEYVYGHVALATVPTILVIAFVHMWWQHRCDVRDAAKAEEKRLAAVGSGSSAVTEDDVAEVTVEAPNQQMSAIDEAIERSRSLPGFYSLLPLLPLLLILITAILHRTDVLPFEADILPATIVSIMIAIIIEMIRRREVTAPIDAMKDFFKGLGEGAGGVVSLIVAAAVLVEGITQLGVIDMLTTSTEGVKGAGFMIVMIFVGATALIAVLTGSGVAPYFAFSELVPGLAAEGAVMPVQMLNSIWSTSNLMRQVSPVAAVMLIVAGAIKVNPFELVRRTAVPMIVGTIVNIALTFLFIQA